jgi:hypothetical protein
MVYAILPKGKRMKLRYEDLIENPDSTLARIQKITNTPFQMVDLDNLSTGYIFRANRIRLQRTVKLERRLKKAQMNSFLKAVVYFVHFPFILLNPRKYNAA